ncbi:HAD family hydrolase, partial [Bifidobacterium bifidum]|uniref:HAD family hydrolase n=1 Tax=Bifidobacterium bifidum TaxID=1681 RepID=UPI002433385B
DQTTVQDDRALTLLSYLTFLDLPKPDAADTIAHMHDAGITVTMLTGDEPQVARAVARKVGINARRVGTGRTLDDMTDTALGTELRRVNVFAKLTPEHKARIVSLLRREGHCV